MNEIAKKIAERFPSAFVDSSEDFGELVIRIRREAVAEVCRFLHDEPDLAFDHLITVTSIDWMEDVDRFEVVYQLYSIRWNRRVRLKARVPEEDCAIASVSCIWRGAAFPEREVFDLMGIRFAGHPDLRRIFLPDDYDGHPLRKDYPLEGKGWRDTFEFLPIIEPEAK